MAAPRSKHGFSMIELVIVVFVIGIIAAIAMPKFSYADSGRRLSTCQRAVRGDIELIQTRARTTGKTHVIQFYPAIDKYVAFEGTEIKKNNIVLSRDLSASPYEMDLSRTTIGGDQYILISPYGDLEKDFSVGILDDGIEILIDFDGVGFTGGTVTITDTVLEIDAGVADLSVSDSGLTLNLGL